MMALSPWIVFFCLTISINARAAVTNDGSSIARTDSLVWEEEIPSAVSLAETRQIMPRRKLFTTSRLRFKQPTNNNNKLNKNAHVFTANPHPLRTDEWSIQLRWKRRNCARQTLLLEFADNGYVRSKTAQNETLRIGSWELTSTGLTWSLGLEGDDYTADHSFHADLHINPFGIHPKLSRGIVIEGNERTWFRPVIATFTGEGIGRDLADFSYKHRR